MTQKQNWRIFAIVVLCAIGIALGFGKQSNAQTRSDISTLTWRQPYGTRGQNVPLTVKLTNTGQPLSGWQVRFWDQSDSYGPRYLGSAWTNGSGYAQLSYTIPTSPLADNVIVTARFDPYWTLPPGTVTYYSTAESSIRVQIGRSYP